MTNERDFERLARAWLELSPNEAPDRTIEAVLRAIETTPQVRRSLRWRSWRHTIMSRNLLFTGAAAVVLVALGAVLLLGRGSTPAVGTASPLPSPTHAPAQVSIPSPSAAGTGSPVPSQLQGRWMGGGRAILGFPSESGLSILFTGDNLVLTLANKGNQPVLSASASAVGSQGIETVSAGPAGQCTAGDIGRYDWSLTPDGRTLTLTAVSDPCATRLAALPGTWWLDGCKNAQTDCLGDLAAGTYESQYIAPRVKPAGAWNPVFGAVTYTVPAGWANSSDWPTSFGLTPSSDYAQVAAGGDEGSRSIVLVTQPAAFRSSKSSACGLALDPAVPRTVSAEIAAIQHAPGLIVTAPSAITVGGHQGQWLDLRLNPTWKASCGGRGPEDDYLTGPGTGPAMYIVGTAQRQRVILLDLGSGDLIAIVVTTDTASEFSDFAAQAMPVIDSLTFK